MFESDTMESEMIWILGVYVQLVWEFVVCKKKALKLEVMKSEIHLRHTTHQNSNMPDLGHIIGLLD